MKQSLQDESAVVLQLKQPLHILHLYIHRTYFQIPQRADPVSPIRKDSIISALSFIFRQVRFCNWYHPMKFHFKVEVIDLHIPKDSLLFLLIYLPVIIIVPFILHNTFNSLFINSLNFLPGILPENILSLCFPAALI